jgi:hypothetical protein
MIRVARSPLASQNSSRVTASFLRAQDQEPGVRSAE